MSSRQMMQTSIAWFDGLTTGRCRGARALMRISISTIANATINPRSASFQIASGPSGAWPGPAMSLVATVMKRAWNGSSAINARVSRSRRDRSIAGILQAHITVAHRPNIALHIYLQPQPLLLRPKYFSLREHALHGIDALRAHV